MALDDLKVTMETTWYGGSAQPSPAFSQACSLILYLVLEQKRLCALQCAFELGIVYINI